jgi:hypothetical protein
MRTLPSALLSVVVISGGILANACSAPAPGTGLSTGDQTATPAPSSGKLPSSGSSSSSPAPAPSASTPTDPNSGAPVPATDGGVTPPPTQADCSATADFNACNQCCDSNSGGGLKVADDAYLACICQTPGVCAQACATSLCGAGGGNPSPQCESCLGSQKAFQCEDAAGSACQGSPACQAAQQCMQQSNCQQKP